jgi:signal transduction histidine kinase
MEHTRRTLLVDAALALALLAFCLLTAPFLRGVEGQQRTVDLLGSLLLAAACLPVAVHRRWPLAALGLTTAAVASYLVLDYPYGPVFLPLVVSAYAVGRRLPLRFALPAAGIAYAALLVHLLGGSPLGVLGVLPAGGWIAVPLTIGVARRMVAESRERERVEAERRKVEEERLRLATEVHDIVGHGLAAIQMQADVALHVADKNPDQARVALETISAASSAALGELRATLSRITPRQDRERQAHAPTPGLARIAELVGRVRDAGVAVELEVTGDRRAVPTQVDVTAYRIVQEALTNVVKHAAAPRATVRVGHRPDGVELEVTSPHTGDPIEEGFGITGMRRRVEQLGGELAVEAGPEVRVRALLPVAAG